VAQRVSVPEKTLEHWASLYVMYRTRSQASLWWPANGQDIDVQVLPAEPAKVVQLELKTTTPSGSRLQIVHIDVGQLWEYSQKPWLTPGRAGAARCANRISQRLR
jgi:hypothetical protein